MKLQPPAPANPSLSRPKQSRPLLTYALLTALLVTIAMVYWPGLNGGFVFDDYPNIVFNTNLHVTRLVWGDWIAAVLSSQSSDMQRPLAMLSFALNHYLTGLNPWPMKLSNLAVHLLNTWLVFGLIRSLLRATIATATSIPRDRIALFVSACWALMPINLMAVLLVVQRMEILCHTFVFAGLWLYVLGRLRQREGRPGWGRILCGVLLGTGLGVLSKESAVLLPLYAFFFELCVFRFRRQSDVFDPWLMALFAGVLVIPVVAGLAWLLPRSVDPAAYAHRNFTLAERLLTEPRIVLDYLRWTLAPDLGQLSLFHDDYPVSRGLWNPPATLLGWIAIPVLVFIAWWTGRRRPLISLGLTWFLGAQLLTATFIPLELVFEHRNYFASLGISLVLTDLLLIAPRAQSHRRIGMIVAGLLLVFYAASTHLRALEWSNPISFAQTEAAKHPQSPRATYHLAQTFAGLSEGKADSPFTPAAFAAFERARQAPRANIAPAQGALLLAARTGKPLKAEWWQDMQTRLRGQPIGPQELGALGALTDCAIAGRCRFPPDEMLNTYAAALSNGDNPEVLNVYGNYALNVLRDAALAERLWKEASRMNPGEPQYVIGLAKLMIALGRANEASDQIRKLRSMGKLGQYESVADSLDVRLANAIGDREHKP